MIRLFFLKLRFFIQNLIERISRSQRSSLGLVPPPKLRYRVHGSTDAEGYSIVGKQSWESVARLLELHGLQIDDFESILDFGCGPGRVIVNIPESSEGKTRKSYGADIDPEAIAWCKKHIPSSRFTIVDKDPPLPFDDNSFDLIYTISVFTHLDETMQFSWLDELRRVLKPNGIAIASLHGDYHRTLSGKSRDISRGFKYTRAKVSKHGLPDFYQDAQHSREYVEREWANYFEVLDYVERGVSDHHDAVVLRKRTEAHLRSSR